MTYPLTSASGRDYASLTAGIPVVEIGVSVQRRTTASARFFYVRRMACPFYGRVVWGASGLAGSFVRYANLHDSAHPIGVGEAENITRLQRSMIMSKSDSASAPNKSLSLTEAINT